MPRERGGVESQVSVAKSFSIHRHNVMLSFNYHATQPLIAKDRSYTSPDMSIFSNYPTKFILNALKTPLPRAHPDCGKDGLSQKNPQTGYCEMDIAPFMNIIPKAQQYGGLVSWNYPAAEGWTFFSTALLSQKHVLSSLPPSPGILYADGTPEFVFRFFEAGRREVFEEIFFYNVRTGLQKEFSSGWQFQQHLGISSFQLDLKGDNFLQAQETSILYDCSYEAGDPDYALGDGECDSGRYFDPFEEKGKRGDLSSALRTPRYLEDSTLLSLQSRLEGDVQVAGKSLELLAGLEWERDFYNLKPPKESYLLAPQFNDAKKDRQVTSALFGLGTLFFDSRLRVDLNLRWDEYSDFGTAWSPRIAFLSHPLFKPSCQRFFGALLPSPLSPV